MGGHEQRGIIARADGTVRMANGRVRLPDVAYFSRDRLPGGRAPREPIPTLAPDLAVEVLSESNTPAEIDQKLRDYFDSGTRLVDPRSRAVAAYHAPGEPIHVLDEAGRLNGEQVLPIHPP